MTDGALAAHDHGIVTACSVVAGGRDLVRAVELLRQRPALEAGLHLVLAGGPLVSRSGDVPSLLAAGTPISGYRAFLARSVTGRVHMNDIEREIRAQVARLRATGLRLTHLNGHQHLHVLPGVIEIVARVAREVGIGYVRIPEERVLPSTPRAAQIWSLGLLARRARRILHTAGVATNDRAIGILDAGHLSSSRLQAGLRGAHGLTEVVAHPGAGNAAIALEHAWGYDWDGEREALSDGRLRSALAAGGTGLARPSEVAPPPSRD